MFMFLTRHGSRDCSGYSRREFLQVGALGMGGLSLPWLLQQQASAATGGSFVRDKSVVFLFLTGGPSHIETWDPKMTAPLEIRSMTGEVKTNLSGVTFGGTFPKLAAHADKLAIVRSFTSGTGSHTGGTDRVLRGGGDDYSLGSMYSRLRGATSPVTGIPTYIGVNDMDKETAYANGRNRVIAGSAAGSLGQAFEPFDPTGKGPLQKNMTLRMSAEQFGDRQRLLSQLDQARRGIDQVENVRGSDAFRQQALDVILGSAREAFDLSKEDPAVLERYDTRRFKIGHKSRHPSPLGRHLLLARRLCEAGCGFVTIGSPAWDMHEGGNNPGIIRGFTNVGPPLDHALSAFLEDIYARGLEDKIMLVVTGEMGRTPRINKKGGRDHWGNITSLLLAGGGLRVGQVIGQSQPNAGAPATTPQTPRNLMGTIMHTLFDYGQLRVERGMPRDLVSQIDRAQPIEGVM